MAVTRLLGSAVAGNTHYTGEGLPEGFVTAPPGVFYTNTGEGHTLWMKDSGTGASGWVPVPLGSETIGASAIRRATTGPVTLTPFNAGNAGTWTLYPASLRVTVPAAVGDVLVFYPSLIANSGPAEGDLCSVVSGAPARYYSSGSGTQLPNGHGGLYLDGAFGLGQPPTITWVVEAGDVDDGDVTLSLLYRAGGSRAIGSAVYPSTIDVINFGPPAE